MYIYLLGGFSSWWMYGTGLTYRRRLFASAFFVVPLETVPDSFEITEKVAAEYTIAETAPGGRLGFAERRTAAAPVTWGQADDVPVSVRALLSPVFQAESIFSPGAKMSTQLPEFEKDGRVSSLLLAATVIAVGSEAGENLQLSWSVFPAAVTTGMPCSNTCRTILFTEEESGAISDIDTTAGLLLFVLTSSSTNWRPAIKFDVYPKPAQPRTLTEMTFAFLATPNDFPAMTPATWVPWPTQSTE
jgi:hypothetical protein